MLVPDEVIEKLKRLAAEEARFDNEDFNAYDCSGGNFDDAYDAGCGDGQIELAREILDELKIEYK